MECTRGAVHDPVPTTPTHTLIPRLVRALCWVPGVAVLLSALSPRSQQRAVVRAGIYDQGACCRCHSHPHRCGDIPAQLGQDRRIPSATILPQHPTCSLLGQRHLLAHGAVLLIERLQEGCISFSSGCDNVHRQRAVKHVGNVLVAALLPGSLATVSSVLGGFATGGSGRLEGEEPNLSPAARARGSQGSTSAFPGVSIIFCVCCNLVRLKRRRRLGYSVMILSLLSPYSFLIHIYQITWMIFWCVCSSL